MISRDIKMTSWPDSPIEEMLEKVSTILQDNPELVEYLKADDYPQIFNIVFDSGSNNYEVIYAMLLSDPYTTFCEFEDWVRGVCKSGNYCDYFMPSFPHIEASELYADYPISLSKSTIGKVTIDVTWPIVDDEEANNQCWLNENKFQKLTIKCEPERAEDICTYFYATDNHYGELCLPKLLRDLNHPDTLKDVFVDGEVGKITFQ